MKKIAFLLCIIISSPALAHEEPSILATILVELKLSLKGARDDAREILQDAQESMRPITNEFKSIFDDIKSDYADFNTQAQTWYKNTKQTVAKKLVLLARYLGYKEE